jgi:hypothetical protein
VTPRCAEKLRYQVERTYENYITGSKWTFIFPKIYKTFRGAEAKAKSLRWATMPDRDTRLDRSDARVIEVRS